MGYNTDFSGVLEFKHPLNLDEQTLLETFLGADCRDHHEWDSGGLTYIDLKLTEEEDGIQWDGSEKTYDLVEKVNLIIKKMKEASPRFELTGEMFAQGEEVGDIWRLVMKDGIAVREGIETTKEKVKCPHCQMEFYA